MMSRRHQGAAVDPDGEADGLVEGPAPDDELPLAEELGDALSDGDCVGDGDGATYGGPRPSVDAIVSQ
jgi:hypothetical protein